MFILAKNKKRILKRLNAYIAITAFIAIFGFVYEQFSHNVHSFFMWFAWLWSLGFGVGAYVLLYFLPVKRVPGMITECIYNLGVALLTAGSIYKGVIDIYGTTADVMISTYFILGASFVGIGLFLYIIFLAIPKQEKPIDNN